MKKTFATLLGSAAALALSSMAMASDAVVAAEPSPTPETAVKVCDAFGTGYFYIPGSETCLKISGAVSFSAGYDSNADDAFSGVDARIGLDTRSDSEFGTIGTTLRFASKSNVNDYIGGATPVRTDDIEAAYITVGPAFAGYKETLFNTKLGYGQLEADALTGGDYNTTTIGFLQNGIYGGAYVGLALESAQRGKFIGNDEAYRDGDFPDVVGRVGYDAPLGTFDVSAAYSDNSEAWYVKGTADVKATDQLGFIVAAAYGKVDKNDANADGYLVSGAGKYAFTDAVSAFAGLGYVDTDYTKDGVFTNVGLNFEPVKDLTVTGELFYNDADNLDNFNSMLTVTRKF